MENIADVYFMLAIFSFTFATILVDMVVRDPRVKRRSAKERHTRSHHYRIK